MILTTSDSVPAYEAVEVLALARGSTVRARHIGRDILAGLKGVVGGEVREYTKMLAEAREQALDRMVGQAEQVGADAVITIRFMTSEVMQGAAEIVAYGTAVKLARKDGA